MKLFRFYTGTGYMGSIWATNELEAIRQANGLYDGYTQCIESDPVTQP